MGPKPHPPTQKFPHLTMLTTQLVHRTRPSCSIAGRSRVVPEVVVNTWVPATTVGTDHVGCDVVRPQAAVERTRLYRTRRSGTSAGTC